MKVACPKCRKDFPVPSDIISRGVARVACASCGFGFVIRLGDPNAAKQKKEPEPPVKIEGLKSSNSSVAVAGEIGSQQERVVSTGTQTSIKLDPALMAELDGAARRAPPQITITATKSRPGDITEPEVFPPGLEDAEQLAPPERQPATESVSPAAADTEPISLALSPAEEDLTDEALEEVEEGPASDRTAAAPGDHFESYRSPEMITPPPGLEAAPRRDPTHPGWASTRELAPSLRNAPTLPEMVPGDPAAPAQPPAGAPPAPAPALAPAGAVTLPHPAALPSPGAPAYPPAYAYVDPESFERAAAVYALPEPQPGKTTKVLGVLMTLIILCTTLLFLFLLMQNNWSFDLAHFGSMVERAFGGKPTQDAKRRQLRGLLLSEHLVEESSLAADQRVLAVKGALKNNDTLPRRYVYVRAILEDNHGRTVTSAEAPAGNIFSAEELKSMTAGQLHARINPAGADGKNLRFLPGDSMAFMVVLTKLPANYSRQKHRVRVEVSRGEFFAEE